MAGHENLIITSISAAAIYIYIFFFSALFRVLLLLLFDLMKGATSKLSDGGGEQNNQA